MSSTFKLKDPDSFEPFGFNWTKWLANIGPTETIATSTWSCTGPDALLVLSLPTIVTGGLRTQVLATGGTEGSRYSLTNSIVSSSGFKDDRSQELLVQQR